MTRTSLPSPTRSRTPRSRALRRLAREIVDSRLDGVKCQTCGLAISYGHASQAPSQLPRQLTPPPRARGESGRPDHLTQASISARLTSLTAPPRTHRHSGATHLAKKSGVAPNAYAAPPTRKARRGIPPEALMLTCASRVRSCAISPPERAFLKRGIPLPPVGRDVRRGKWLD
jgi:hypothetical protein